MTKRALLNKYVKNPAEAIKQLEECGYSCEGGPLENNVAFIFLKAFVKVNSEGGGKDA